MEEEGDDGQPKRRNKKNIYYELQAHIKCVDFYTQDEGKVHSENETECDMKPGRIKYKTKELTRKKSSNNKPEE